MKLLTKREVYNWFEKHFPDCGCGAPTETRLFIAELIEAFGAPDGDGEWKTRAAKLKSLLPGIYDVEKENFAEWALLYALDRTGIIEHGVNVRWSWVRHDDAPQRLLKSIRHYRQAGALEEMFGIYQTWSIGEECTDQNWTPMSYEGDVELKGWDDVPEQVS